MRKTLGVLGGNDVLPGQIRAWLQSADFVIAADQGAELIPPDIRVPDVLIGDLDSVSEVAAARAKQVIQIACQETTDTEKLLTYCLDEGLTPVTLIGFEGDLLDHVIANVYCLARYDLDLRVALRAGIMWFVSPRFARTINVAPGARVSLLPIKSCSGVELSGVEWPILGGDLSPGGLHSISNRATSKVVQASVRMGAALLFIELAQGEMPRWDG